MATNRDGHWSAEDKFRAVRETARMGKAELGAYCLQHGIHTHQLDRWREQCIAPLRRGGKIDPKMMEVLDEIQRLNKELKLKEKELAEVLALLALERKMEALRGDSDDEEC